MIAHLISVAWKKDGWDLASLADGFQAMIQLTADQQAPTDKEVINTAAYGNLNHLVEFAQLQFIRIDQDSQLFLSKLPGFDEFRVQVIPAGFHWVKIGKQGAWSKEQGVRSIS
jgi:hypothetical protein